MLTQSLKEYYKSKYPQDIELLGTFLELYEVMVLGQGEELYSLFGIPDSLVREELFARLAQLIGKDYQYVYRLWLYGSAFK